MLAKGTERKRKAQQQQQQQRQQQQGTPQKMINLKKGELRKISTIHCYWAWACGWGASTAVDFFFRFLTALPVVAAAAAALVALLAVYVLFVYLSGLHFLPSLLLPFLFLFSISTFLPPPRRSRSYWSPCVLRLLCLFPLLFHSTTRLFLTLFFVFSASISWLFCTHTLYI